MASPPPHSATRRSDRRRLAHRLLVAALVLIAFAASAPGAMADPPKALIEVPDWRERGLAHVDLPLRFRARFDTSYTRHTTGSDRLASPFVGQLGPSLDLNPVLETRVAITRPLADRIELEISWQTRNELTMGDPMAFGRQIVGAFIRITP